MYIYESIKDEIWRRPEDIVFYEITVRYPNTWDDQDLDILIETHMNQVVGQVFCQLEEDLEDLD
jgi:hypothetical protein